MTKSILTDDALDIIFRTARTANAWQDKPVEDSLLHQIHDVMKFGATSANCWPLRTIFIKTPEAKARLKPYLAEGNIEKTMSAPVTAIFAYDTEFYEHLPKLFPHTDAKSWFVGNDDLIQSTAMRNGTLQAAYFMIAARSLGLDCGPMSGYDQEKLDADFFPDGKIKSDFLCNLGYGDHSATFPRSPRFDFSEVCEVL